MKRSTAMTALLASMTVALGGCQGIHLANLVALSVTVGLFFGTLQLGRTTRRPGADDARDNQPSVRPAASTQIRHHK